MLRIRLSDYDTKQLFSSASIKGYDVKQVATLLGVSERTVRDWRRGKHSLPVMAVRELCRIADVELSGLQATVIDENDQKSAAGKVGGRSYWQKYGSLGTISDKQRGGVNSYRGRVANEQDIFSRKTLYKPPENERLAEFIGICMGDGGMTDYQLTISLNADDDKEYAGFVVELGTKLFHIAPTLTNRKTATCVNVVFSSANLVDFLQTKGLPKGDKLRAGLDIPAWIRADDVALRACIRGLFDTDGSIFMERHRTLHGEYAYPRMAFVSMSAALRETVRTTLCELGIDARCRQNRSVSIERFTDIEKYFRIVGSSNQKHLSRFATYGGVG